ncbi:hypothetical protein M8J75_015882 [Diaphorina citri]|nr:hypothetical protein M8J75_015882 [Diaphorina citri]
MSDEESVDFDGKLENKKKVRKRKSKPNDDEDYTEVKVQRKSKKIKVETKPSNPLLKWLNTSADKSLSSQSPELIDAINPESKNEPALLINKEVNNTQKNVTDHDSTSLEAEPSPFVDYLLSEINFSNLKAKINAKLCASPKSEISNSVASSETDNNPEKNGTPKSKRKERKTKSSVSNDAKKTSLTNDVKRSSTKGNVSTNGRTIQDMFQRMNGQADKVDTDSKTNGTAISSEDDESDELFDPTFLDSDNDGSMIFLSNKFDRRKVVDSADSDSVDSFVRTPIKNEELMAPPYSPLSPLCRKSPRHLTGSPLRSPRHLKSPLAVRNNVRESPKSLKTTQNQDVVPTRELNADSCLSSQLVKESTNETSEKDDSSKKLSKNLFGAPENEQESCPEEELKTTKKVKKLKKKETTCGQNNSVNDEITSDEDFKTPKKKPKPARKKKAEEKPNNSEKMVKDDRGKKKESPNPNSSLLNYFKKVEVSKDVEVNQIENVDETTPSLAETGDISDSKQSENSVEKKRNKKKKAKKKKRKDCVEIRFDFESDASVELGGKEEAIEKSESEDLKGDCIRENERAIPNEDDCKESLEMENDKGKEEVTKPVEKLEQASNDRLETKEKQEDEHKRNSETDKHCGDSGNKEDNKDSKEEKEELSEVPKKRGRGRPKKVKTEHEGNKTDIKEEEENSERREIEEPLTEVEGEEEEVHDDKENERKSRRKSRKREKKELQEHCDNVDGSGGDEEESKPKEATSLFKYFKKVDSIVDADCKRDSNVLKVEVQIHTPPSTPKSKRKSKPPLSPLPPPTLTPSGEEGRRKSSRISEKMKLKEEAKKIEDEILVLEEEEESGKKKSKRKHGGQDSDDEVFILKEKKAPSFSPGPQSKVKLASIFLKKPKLTKMQTEARQRFLQSGVPDAIRRQTELLRKQEELLEELEYYSFPLINHVTQSLSHQDHLSDLKTDPFSLGRFRLRDESGTSTLDGLSESGTLTLNGLNGFKSNKLAHSGSNIVESDSKLTHDGSVPSIEHTSLYRKVEASLSTPRTEEKDQDPSSQLTNQDSSTQLLVWSEKYKPETEQDILGNRTSVETLRAWLETQKRAQRPPLYKDSSDEDADFIDDNDSSSQFDNRHNTAILIGPSGCGKTCTVYALANQLGFKVIELNASCNRNGKRILSDLSEATQSHQVQHQTQSCAPITSFFSKQPSQNPPNEQRTGEKSLKLSSQEGKTTEKSLKLPSQEGKTTGKALKVYSQEGKGKRESAKRKREEDTPEKPARKSQIKKKKGDKTEDKSDRHPAKSKGAKTGEKVVKKKGDSKEKTSQKRRGAKEAESGLESEGHFTKNVGNLGIPVGNFGKTAGNFTSVGTFSVKSEEKEPAGEKDEAKMSLILIEDADVLFSDHDDGFVSALSSLVASSKRPLILVTSQERVTHLAKFMRLPHSLVLHFTTPLYTEIGSFLQLVAILEGVKLSQDKSLLLIHHNRGDIRKCLLALQYYVLSRKCYPSQSTPPWADSEAANLAAIWWQWSSLYKLAPLLYNHTRTKLTLQDHEETNNGQVEHTASRELRKSAIVKTKSFLDDEFFCDGNEKKSANDIKSSVNDEGGDNTSKKMGNKKIGTKSELPEEVRSAKDAKTNGENDPENVEEMEQTEEVGQSKLGNGQSSQSNENEDKNRRSTGDDMESNEKDERNENIPLPNSEESGYSSSCQNSQQDSEQSNQQNSQPLSQQNSQQDQEISQQSRQWGQQNSETMSQRNSQQGQEQCQQSSQQNGSLSQQNSANLQFLKTSFASRFASLSQFESSKAEMRNLSRLLTCYSQVDLIHGKLDVSCADSNPCPRIWESCPSASSSLELSSLSSQSMLCRDLGASLISFARGLVPGEITLSVNGPWEETKRHTHQLFSLERSLLSSLSPSEALSRYGFPLDLYSGVRGLARIERHRFETSSKRYNRFFNHLKSVNIHLSKSETERLCASLSLTD